MDYYEKKRKGQKTSKSSCYFSVYYIVYEIFFLLTAFASAAYDVYCTPRTHSVKVAMKVLAETVLTYTHSFFRPSIPLLH